MPLVLHVYDPFDRPEDQVLTWEALARMTNLPYARLAHQRTLTPVGYARALQGHWHYGEALVIVEQDIVPRLGQVEELLACEHKFCAFDYNLSHGVPWSECPGAIGLGLSKISKAARLAVTATPAVPQHAHRDMPGLLAERLPPVHVHRPLIEHHHGAA